MNGWHLREWAAESAGTAILMFAVVTAKFWCVAAGCSEACRIAIVAVVAGLAVIAIAYSPLGRRSGAHLNPAVTFGLWLQRVAGTADLAGYCVAQFAGGVLGVAAARIWGPDVAGRTVNWAVIAPASRLGVIIEAAAVLVQLGVVYALLTSERLQRWTAPVAAVLLTLAIVLLAPISGAGFNPVRGFAPDLLANTYPALWIYFVGPLSGAALAAVAVNPQPILAKLNHDAAAAVRRRPITGKLRHDPRIPCYMRCELPHLAEQEQQQSFHEVERPIRTGRGQPCA